MIYESSLTTKIVNMCSFTLTTIWFILKKHNPYVITIDLNLHRASQK